MPSEPANFPPDAVELPRFTAGESLPPIRLAVVVLAMWPYRNRFYDEIAKNLGPASEVAVFSADVSGYSQDENLARMRVVHLPALRGKRGLLAKDWPNPALWRRLDVFNPTHVWVHEFSPFVSLALLWAKIHARPCFVSTEIGERFPARYSRPNVRYQNFIKCRISGVIAHTQAAAETAQRVARRSLFVPHGIDAAAYVPREPGEVRPVVRLLQVGGLNERKGVDLLLHAFRRCVDAHPAGVELVLLGEGDRPWVEGLVRALDLQRYVRLKPFARGQDLIEEYRQADVFVHASREDTYAVVVHEAAACGLPLVVSRYAGASEVLVEEGVNGFVIDPFDAESFGAAMLKLVENGSLRGSFGKRARERAQHFSVQENAARTAAWIRE